MGVADIPTSFGFSTFLRIFIPGFISSIIYSYALIPIIIGQKWILLPIEQKILLWIIFGIIIGLLIMSFDIHIYQLFEGIRYWPKRLWNFKYKLTKTKFEFYDYNLKMKKLERDSECDEVKIKELSNEISDLLFKIREYPSDPESKFSSGRYPQEATRFGNVLAEYETYSERQYGMHMRVFWYHLWDIMPTDLQKDLDLKGASADYPLYLSLIFLTYAIIGTLGYLMQYGQLFAAFCFICSLVLSGLFYQAAISAHKVYGNYIKAAFDLYRIDIAKKLDLKASLIPSDEEISMWQDYWHFLLDYKKPNSKKLL